MKRANQVLSFERNEWLEARLREWEGDRVRFEATYSSTVQRSVELYAAAKQRAEQTDSADELPTII